ncbi:hypothetical protein ACFL2M_02180 [Patescibacteria group bacterium]
MRHFRLSGFSSVEKIIATFGVVVMIAAVAWLLYNAGSVGSTRNAERTKDVRTIMDAVYQHSIDHGGVITAEIDTSLQMIGTAQTGCAIQCGDVKLENDTCLNLAPLLADEYIIDVPFDPAVGSQQRTYYAIKKTEGQRLHVAACKVEQGVHIYAAR